MLPKFSSEIPEPQPRITVKCDGEDAAGRGAFPCGAVLTYRAAVPRRFGTAGVVMRVSRDTGAPGEDGFDGSARDLPFGFVSTDGAEDIYTLTLDTASLCGGTESALFYYEFIFPRGCDTRFSDTADNVNFALSAVSARRFRLLIYERRFTVPAYLGGGIMYHIFVDRFRRGEGEVKYRADSVINPDWDGGVPQYGERRGSPVANNVFFGGNLWGVAEKLPYLRSLGVSVIYLSPVFDSPTNHKYDTSDYMRVDPGFGGDAALEALIEAAHAAGIRLILDGVFNHTGDDSIYFDIYNRYGGGAAADPDSPCRDWFYLRPGKDGNPDYECWWGVPIMPKLNLGNKDCLDFFTGEGGVIDRYTSAGIDGWRLDVADELPDTFIEALRCRARSINPETAVIGEVWENAADKVSYGKRRSYFRGRQLDSVMNYPLRSALLAFATEGDAELLASALTELYSSYPPQVASALMNIVGTHDTERVLTVLGNPDAVYEAAGKPNAELARMRLTDAQYALAVHRLMVVSALQYTVYGFPCVYYGDETGMEGMGDPFCRRPFPWGHEDAGLLEHYRRLGALRLAEPVFDGGDFSVNAAAGGYIEYSRRRGGVRVTVAANMGGSAAICNVAGEWRDLYTGMTGSGGVAVPPCGFVILRQEVSDGTV